MATNKPPAGTATHKPMCNCPQCKGRRYDVLLTEHDALKTERDGLKARVARQSAEIQNRTVSQKRAEERARDLFTELRLIASAAGVGGHADERWPSEIKRVLNQLHMENNAITAERDGYAAELKVLTQEANAQRLAADTATTRVGQLLTENTSLRTQLTQAAESPRAGRGASAIGWIVLVGIVNFLLGRWTR